MHAHVAVTLAQVHTSSVKDWLNFRITDTNQPQRKNQAFSKIPTPSPSLMLYQYVVMGESSLAVVILVKQVVEGEDGLRDRIPDKP